MIRAGQKSDIQWNSGPWVFLDIGFSAKQKSCGLLVGDGSPQCLTFADARRRILDQLTPSSSLVNLVIEAPLSVSFDSRGNPTGRTVERFKGKTRPWYVGPGCAVMVAAIYLVRAIEDTQACTMIRLFEGFVSYKDRPHKGNSSHQNDVLLLREAVQAPEKHAQSLFDPDQLKSVPTDSIRSAFYIMGLDCGVPVVIKRDA